jgi:hypothetical protein
MAEFYLRFLTQRRKGAKLIGIAILLLVVGSVSAQSIDPNAPSPVRTNSITGRIAARDLGDARLTDHYYALTGTPGDLLITVNSTNLNGDIDVFTATTLRPLLKLTLYAESTAPVTKGIYLRKREDLILRIEARSPNDDEGTYRLFFGGSFEPIAGGPEIAETETPVTATIETRTPGTKRVSSVGARIKEPEPPVEVATATPSPEPTPEPTPEAKPAEKPAAASSPEVETEKPATVRNTRGRRPAGRRPAPRVRETPPAPVEEPKPKPAPEPEPEVGPRLVIETNDGTLINRSMSTVKRVTVENGQVVVTGKDGKIDRILLVNVVRMSIAP